MKSLNEEFCKYCGSSEIKSAQTSRQQNKAKSIQPSLGIGPVTISAGIGIGKGSAVGYETKHCVKCLNLDVDIAYSPFTISSSYSGLSIIIPYTLYTLLNTCEYQLEEILSLIGGLKDTLDRIYRKWSQVGNNPCKRGRVGYKLQIELKRNMKITCWVIVDLIKNKVIHRLTYAGAKVNCP